MFYFAMRKSRAQLRTMAIRAALPMAILGKPATPPGQMDLRIDSNWSSQNGHRNGINGTSVNNSTNGTQPSKPSPKPHPMNRSVSAAVVESRIKREPVARSQSTAAATPIHNGHASSSAGQQPSNDLNLAPVLFGVIIVLLSYISNCCCR